MLGIEAFMQSNEKLAEVEVKLSTGQHTPAKDVLNVARAFESTS
jgi:hypothetical protein